MIITFYVKVKPKKKLFSLMVSTLIKASIWFNKNRLVVNSNTSCLIPIASINKVKLLCSDINIYLGDK